MDPRTPVIVGVGAVTDHSGQADELSLMAAAIERCGNDAGAPALLAAVELVLVPRGTWQHADPGRGLAAGFGAEPRSLLAELGVLQSTLIARACQAISSGDAEVTLVVGGEAAYSAKRRGVETRPLPGATGEGLPPDEVLRPKGDIVSSLEILRQFWVPAQQYALIERALGRSRDELDASWSRFADVAAQNPSAWRPEAVSAASLGWATETNPPVALPYGRRHCSQMNVDQAAALLIVSAERAAALGVPRDQWIFPTLVAESNHMAPVPTRTEPDRCPAFAVLGETLAIHTGLTPRDAELIDLYSCFPAAVEVQRRELGLDDDRVLTVTGGMSFAGGPFNNYVLQSTVRMTELLRSTGASTGLVTAISGMITKQGVLLLESSPGDGGFHWADVSDDAARRTSLSPLCPDPDAAEGPARVVSSTVVEGAERRAWVLAELSDGTRTLASSTDCDLVDEWCGSDTVATPVTISGPGFCPA